MKIKLYHPSDYKFNIVKIKYFGQHYYTNNDVKASALPRSFWYFELPIPEKRFQNNKFIYQIEINDNKLYNLIKDPDNIINKFNTIHKMLCYLKQYYIGVYYKPNTYKIACIFFDIKPDKIIRRD